MSDDVRVGIVVKQNLSEAPSRFGHGSGSCLAESNTVSVADASEQNAIAVFCERKVVARNSAPANVTSHRQASGLIGSVQQFRLMRGNIGCPTGRMVAAVITADGEVRVSRSR